MLRSMFSGVSGLRSHQTMMDVIGNNIANVNTVGYKSTSVVFQDLLSQTIRGAGAPTTGPTGNGGTNPASVGLGTRIGGVNTSFTQGAAQMTGRSEDLSIQGDGFFVVRQQGQELFTRAGSFSFDAFGRLTTSSGAVLQGWSADAAGVVNTNATTGDLTMPLGQAIAPAATNGITVGGNLPADAPIDATGALAGSKVITSITVFDTQGTAHAVSFEFIHSAVNTWEVEATMPDITDPTNPPIVVGSEQLIWDPDLDPPAFAPVPVLVVTPTVATGEFAAGHTIDVNLGAAGDPDALAQFAGESSMAALSQDGSALGSLQSFTIGQDGVVTGAFSNGRTRAIGQVALAAFTNPAGLERTGSSMYRSSVNSGLANIGVAGGGGRGSLAGSSLEMSNVDLAQEFTSLIVAQRGFQANSRVITASDEILQDLVNLKR